MNLIEIDKPAELILNRTAHERKKNRSRKYLRCLTDKNEMLFDLFDLKVKNIELGLDLGVDSQYWTTKI